MNKTFIILISSLLLMYGNLGYSNNTQNKIIQFKNAKNEFTIVVVKDNINQKIAKQKAINRAAYLSKKNNFSSFDITNEQQVEVILGKSNWPSAYDFPQNLYQEEIVEKGYNRERIISKSRPDLKVRKAYKIQIKCYPNSNGSYKVNEIIK